MLFVPAIATRSPGPMPRLFRAAIAARTSCRTSCPERVTIPLAADVVVGDRPVRAAQAVEDLLVHRALGAVHETRIDGVSQKMGQELAPIERDKAPAGGRRCPAGTPGAR